MTDVKSNVGKKFGIGFAVLAIAGAVGAGLTEVVKEAAKSTVRQTISRVQEKIEQVFPSALPQADKNAAFSIFVAKLDGDPDGSQTKLVRESLRRSFDATDAQHRIEVNTSRSSKSGRDWQRMANAIRRPCIDLGLRRRQEQGSANFFRGRGRHCGKEAERHVHTY